MSLCLEATRKLQRQFEVRGVEFHAVVFIRNDIYQHLVLDPADRGKETAVILDWNDPEVFREMIRRRIMLSTGLSGSFEELWPVIYETHVNGEESFSYILGRTLMRPREVLRFARDCIDVAVNRGHEKVAEEDILHADLSYSEDELLDVSLELKDVNADYADVLYAFIGVGRTLSRQEVADLLVRVGKVRPEEVEKVIEFLLWFGFLGIHIDAEEERYSYQFQHDLKKMSSGLGSEPAYSIHPAFWKALSCAAP